MIPETNAYKNGLKRDDVLLTYGAQRLKGPAELGPAIQAVTENNAGDSIERVPVTVWRGGELLALTVEPGRLGIQPAPLPAPEAISAKRELDVALA